MANNIEYKCPCCGGSLTFSAQNQKIVCEFCGSEFDVNDVKSFNEELSHEVNQEPDWGEVSTEEMSKEDISNLNVLLCESCGGQLVCDDNTSATSCPYCGSPVILKGRLQGALKPDYIIPFKSTKEELSPVFNKYLKKKLFLPKQFKTANQVEEIKGLYVPFWIHDADASGRVRWKGEKIRKYTRGDYKYTERSYYSIIRDGSISFDHIPVDGCKNLDDKLMESIEPYNFAEARPFEAAYLSGFLSDKYDVNREDVYPRATKRVEEGTIDQFRTTVHGYDEVKFENCSLTLDKTSVSYALYPVWIMTTKYKEKSYTFAMNGQTNKIVGNLPCSAGKAILWFFFWWILMTFVFGVLVFACFDADPAAIPLSLIIGCLPGLAVPIIFVKKQKKKLKEVKFQRGAKSYYRPGSMSIYNSKDIFLYKEVSKTKISKD